MAELPKIAEEAVKKIDSKLECSICFEKFKEPKLLPCFHVFCKTCLERLVVQGPEGQSLTCPTCRHNVPLPDNGVAGLQTDFHIEHLFEIKESLEKAKKVDCENCKYSIAIKFCQQCKIMMCEKCTETHQMWGGFKDHQIIDIDDVNADTLTPVKKILRCTKHNDKKLKIYCETCSELICTDCTIRLHKMHDYDLIKDVFPKHKEELVSTLGPLKRKLQKVTQGLELTDARTTEVSDQRATAEGDIHREIDELTIILNQRKEELLASIDSQTVQKLKELAIHRDILETMHAKLSSCLEYAEAGLETGTEGEVLRMKAPVLKRIEEITAEFDSEDIQPRTEADIAEIKYEVQPLLKTCQLLNKTAQGPISAENSYVTGDGAKFAMTETLAFVELHALNSKQQLCDNEFFLMAELVDTNEAVVKCHVVHEAGRHTISYRPVNRGRHSLHIRVNGRHIQGSPYPIAVIPSLESLQNPARVVEHLNGPFSVAMSRNQQMVLAEYSRSHLSVLTPEGTEVISFEVQGKKGPCGVTVDYGDNIYIADHGNNRVQKYSSDGKFINQNCEEMDFERPVGICFNKTNQLLYVCDRNNHRIQVLTTDLKFVRSFGEKGTKEGQFRHPIYAAFDSDNNLYVTDYDNDRVQVFTAEGDFVRQFPNGKKLKTPYALAIDSSNTVYVGEYDKHCVSMFTSQGEHISSFGTKGTQKGKFNKIFGLCVGQNNSIIVADFCNNRLQIF